MIVPCRDIVRRLAEGEYDNAPLWKRVGLRVHFAMCWPCGLFARQMELLGKAARRRWGMAPDPARVEALQRRIRD